MPDSDRIGQWEVERSEPSGHMAGRSNGSAETTEDREGPSSDESGSFNLGVLLGVVPLLVVAIGLLTFLLARDDGQVTVSASPAEEAPSETTAPPPETSSSTVTTLPVFEEAGAIVDDRDLRIVGTLPSDAAAAFVDEMTLLAIGVGLNPQDETTIDDRAPVPDQVEVYHPNLVAYERGSDVLLLKLNHRLDFLVNYLDLVDTTVTVVSLAGDGVDAADNLRLAQLRAGLVFEHLTARGIDPSRVSINADILDGQETVTEQPGNQVDILFSVNL